MRRKDAPPPGADVLYSRFEAVWDARDGLVRVSATSGDFTQHGTTTLRAAMELHHKLGIAIDKALRRGEVIAVERRADS
jgi:hypothetical protein